MTNEVTNGLFVVHSSPAEFNKLINSPVRHHPRMEVNCLITQYQLLQQMTNTAPSTTTTRPCGTANITTSTTPTINMRRSHPCNDLVGALHHDQCQQEQEDQGEEGTVEDNYFFNSIVCSRVGSL